MSDEDAIMQRAAQVQAGLEERHGKETTTALVNAIGQLGLSQDALRQVVASPDAVDDFERLGTESLPNIAQRGQPSDRAVRAADEAYSSIIRYQRETWRANRGR
jgi:hypothetical protein